MNNHQTPICGPTTTEAGKITPAPNRLIYRVSGMRPCSDPYHASSLARNNLNYLMAEADEETLFGLVISDQGIWGWGDSCDPEETLADLRYAFSPIAELVAVEHPMRVPHARVEIKAMQTRKFDGSSLDGFDNETNSMKTQLASLQRGRDAVPQGIADPMWDLLSAINGVPGAAVLSLLSSASTLEQELAENHWRPSFEAGSKTEYDMWQGTKMISARSFLCADIRVPKRMLAERRMISQRIDFARLTAEEQAALRRPAREHLKAHAVPLGVYRSLVVLPAAGRDHPVPGVRTLPPKSRSMPYDRPAPPEKPLRLGMAADPQGKPIEVVISPGDAFRHIRIVGATGSGKSTVIRDLVAQLTETDCGVLAS